MWTLLRAAYRAQKTMRKMRSRDAKSPDQGKGPPASPEASPGDDNRIGTPRGDAMIITGEITITCADIAILSQGNLVAISLLFDMLRQPRGAFAVDVLRRSVGSPRGKELVAFASSNAGASPIDAIIRRYGISLTDEGTHDDAI